MKKGICQNLKDTKWKKFNDIFWKMFISTLWAHLWEKSCVCIYSDIFVILASKNGDAIIVRFPGWLSTEWVGEPDQCNHNLGLESTFFCPDSCFPIFSASAPCSLLSLIGNRWLRNRERERKSKCILWWESTDDWWWNSDVSCRTNNSDMCSLPFCLSCQTSINVF